MNHHFIKRLISFRNLYLVLILVMLISLPLSKYLASASQILLAVTWLAERKFDEKWNRIRSRPYVLIATLLFFIPLLAMVYTEDLRYGLNELKLKLPLLLMPVVLGSIKPFDKNEMRILLGGFVAAVFAGALISLSIMFGIGPVDYTNDRSTVLFISHIRFALMVVLAVFILFYYTCKPGKSIWNTLIPVACALGLILYLFLLKSLTGVLILATGGWILMLRWGLKQSDILARWFVMVALATFPVLAGFYLSGQVAEFYTVKDNPGELDRTTVNGIPYQHDTASWMIENGYHVGLYLCEPELSEAWNQVSEMDYNGPDRKGQELKYTLIRYLTSLGLRKDAYGVSKLKSEDIELIENGMANCIYKHPRRFSVRMYETIWEFDHYRKGANPGGHSVIQRIEYLKTGWAIFRDHPVFGVGTGDIKTAFDRKYEQIQSPLEPKFRLRAHNQFLTFLITFGVIGFILSLCAIILPVTVGKRKISYLVMMFLLVSLLSMLNEDTLDTQAGVAFFAIFYSLFVFADGTSAGSQDDNAVTIDN